MNEKVAAALGYVDKKYITAAAKRKKRKHFWLGAAAAILALVFLFQMPNIPLIITSKPVALSSRSRKMERPDVQSDKYDLWYEESQKRTDVVTGAMTPIIDFSAACSAKVLSGTDTANRVWSPINAYLALAVTSELTDGADRQQIMELLGITDSDELRKIISALWEQIYQDNGKEISVLANSLWLDKDISYRQETLDLLAHHYYTSVYQGDLGSARTNRDIANWLRNQTGGLLDRQTGSVNISPEAVLTLASTVYFQSQWNDKFSAGNNSENTFHAADGDVRCTFMNRKLAEMNYYWADDYGAVRLGLENGSSMWFILPDEDKTVDNVFDGDVYMAMVTYSDAFPEENHKRMKVNLSVPKFDISSGIDLEPALKELGLTALFEPDGNHFPAAIDGEAPVFLDSINQDARVTIDEDGVKAASYLIIEGAGSAEPPKEIIDFVLDRPFVFVITSHSIPLFVGTVNHP